MHITKIVATIAFVFFSVDVLADIKGHAGVIPYSCHNNQAVVLLAFDPYSGRGGWGAFGGLAEKGEIIAQTAAREFREETNCAFRPLDVTGLSASLSGEFYTFFAPVEYVSSTDIENNERCRNIERRDWRWVNLNSLVQALENNSDNIPVHGHSKQKLYLWDGARSSLRQALDDGIMTTSIDCTMPKS